MGIGQRAVRAACLRSVTRRNPMMRLQPVIAAWLSLGAVVPFAARAADDDVATLRAELDQLKSDYSQRVSALESRITQLETQGANAQVVAAAQPAPAEQPAPAAPAGGTAYGGRAATAFNPSISMILAGNYASTSE